MLRRRSSDSGKHAGQSHRSAGAFTEPEPHDVREWLSVGAALYDRADFKARAGGYIVFMLINSSMSKKE